MESWKNIVFILLVIGLGCFLECGRKKPDFKTFPKIDAHVHVYTKEPAFMEQALQYGFQVLTITTGSSSTAQIHHYLDCARYQQKHYPDNIAYTTTFSMEGWEAPDWAAKTINQLHCDFENGAVAVKAWKDIGMTFRDADGDFIMIDDPMFDPVFEFLVAENKPLIAHIGEPRNCWLPPDSITIKSDREYFETYTQYYLYLHPEYPTHAQLMAARDNVMAKHPNLKLIGCHLGSLEWDVDVLAKTLDRYPNFAVDVSARVCHLQIQDREKVRQFLLKYQDRILYGTDLLAADGECSTEYMQWVWEGDWQYFSSKDDSLVSPNFDQQFQGLDLPTPVLKRIYYKNAQKWIPGLFTQK